MLTILSSILLVLIGLSAVLYFNYQEKKEAEANKRQQQKP